MTDDRDTLKVINNFALRLIAIPTKHELAWFIAREVVGPLGFDDCVVYLYDEEKEVLRQTAAIGELKNPTSEEIRNPLEIRIGQGITGHVAQFQEPLVIDVLSKDDRYIPDIGIAQSEICVPLVADGRLFGVIDSESPTAFHFTDTHLQTLTTVAAMASAKLRLLEQDRTLEMHEKLLAAEKETLHALHVAETANKAKTDFLATMSHELRTPLTSIRGALGLLNASVISNQTEDNQSLLDMAMRNCDALVNLVNDFLDYEKIIAGKMVLSAAPVEIGQLAKSTVDISQGLAQTYSIRFVFNETTAPMWARVDETRYVQILRNLLSNAAKFSPIGSPVEISVDDTDTHIRTSVKDFGIGIADKHRFDVFERFTQIDSSDARRQSGTGLGLAISSSLAKSMDGILNFESSLGEGSVFYVDLPKIDNYPG
ncbi:MAG: GAF domain-containing protein [Rhodospirillales bacterium]|nr:GAF domain-containing protein [Rhodospirillales bacterium]